MSNLHRKAQDIIDNLYMYITLVDKELYIDAVRHEVTAICLRKRIPGTTYTHFLTVWCRISDPVMSDQWDWIQTSPNLGAPGFSLDIAGLEARYIRILDEEAYILKEQTRWKDED